MEKLKKPIDLVESVKNSLFEAILTGKLPPGEKLKQEKLAEMLGVSRQPVSHALRILADQGILTGENSKSLSVAKIDKVMVMKIIDVRVELDGYAAELAAKRVAQNVLLQADKLLLALLEKLVKGNVNGKKTNIKQFAREDIEFHYLIRKLANNEYIQASLAPHILHHHRLMYLIGNKSHERIWADHLNILEAIKNGDATVARSLVRAHITRGAETLMRHWEE